ncbi:Assimilatory sulfite reductase [Mycena indigotica]|uniref:assimilatory sulfite reductase (NADPH) n=1 Tax=Mycena indigotica TaxID=2126181 RepID=A0A8H6SNB2_9AGAR|nr:Assimilatory sulfite reductase [Mycena indigotica]KAF7301392.1 Assimilatory sulfite reductase [Mycena indigotica]
MSSSGASTPPTLVSSPTLTAAKPLQHIYGSPRVSASAAVEFLASRPETSSAIYVYDLADQVGFGALTKEWAKTQNASPVVELQTRAGAGLTIVGRLSQGTSRDAGKGSVITAYTTPAGLAFMAPSLSHLPTATPTSRLVIQVPTVVSVGESLALSPSLSSLSAIAPTLPRDLVVLLSATPQEAVDFANFSYRLKTSHVVHLFDHYSAGRETGTSLAPPKGDTGPASLADLFTENGYSFFSYAGDPAAHTVIALLNGPLALAVKALLQDSPGLGLLIVNVLRPWDEQALRDSLPPTVRSLHVFDDVPNASTQGSLYVDIFGTLLTASSTISVHSHRIVPSETLSYLSTQGKLSSFLASFLPSSPPPSPPVSSLTKRLVVYSTPQTALSSAAHFVADTFLSSEAVTTRFLTDHDVFSRKGGVSVSRVFVGPKGVDSDVPLQLAIPLGHSEGGEADFLAVLDPTILTSHSLLQHAKAGSVVLLASNWTPQEVLSNLPVDVTAALRTRQIRLFVIDPQSVAAGRTGPLNAAIQNLVVQLAFLRLYLGKAAQESVVLRIARSLFNEVVDDVGLSEINATVWSTLFEVDISPQTAPESTPKSLKYVEFNAIAVQTFDNDVVNGARLGSWHDAAKHLLFPAAFNPEPNFDPRDTFAQNPALRPEVPDRTFLVTCTVNRRLTAKEYDRNVFHLEFDTRGTGLKYAIGEALGVHGWNDDQEVMKFCGWYGVEPTRLVTIPVPSSEGRMHTRTVFQALQQQIDLFGQPPKSFYTDLAAYATGSLDRHALLFIGSPEGSATFKKMAEKDTVTFADVLQMYPSARPGIEVLCEMVGDIKPRHYSIASAQSVVGDRVDLLVVTVEWMNPSGSPRFGQCTRYLAGLKIGQKVTVSIKPSVMKLPPDNLQPLIMAGLGTGAAPFRAFLQHRAMLVQQGESVGPVYYYFGSRYQSQEYLYGEEIEAFIEDAVITRAGLAFSRDGPKKVYIQHKMLEDAESLAQMLLQDNGVFYLCGPTWPVPDVYEALVGALVKYQGMSEQGAGDYLEGLKEEERYVLEVY